MKKTISLVLKSVVTSRKATKLFKPQFQNIGTHSHFGTFNKQIFNFSSSQSSFEVMKQIGLLERQFSEFASSKDYKKCIEILNEKIKLKTSTPNTSLLNDYRMLGEINQHLGNGQEALNSYEECLKLAIKLDSKEIQAYSLSDIAGIHYLSENYQQAAGYFEESITLLKQVKGENSSDVAMGLLNMGETFVKNSDGNKAIQTYQEAKSIYNHLLSNESLDKNLVFDYNRNKGKSIQYQM